MAECMENEHCSMVLLEFVECPTDAQASMLLLSVFLSGEILIVGSGRDPVGLSLEPLDQLSAVLAQPASAYTPWGCGTQHYSAGQSSGSTWMTSTVYGCKQRVVITCKPPVTGQIYGPLRVTGYTSTANCSSGKILNSLGWQMGTNW